MPNKKLNYKIIKRIVAGLFWWDYSQNVPFNKTRPYIHKDVTLKVLVFLFLVRNIFPHTTIYMFKGPRHEIFIF